MQNDPAPLPEVEGDDGDTGRLPTTLRLLTLLEAVVAHGGPVVPADLHQTVDLPRATLHRLVQTLEAEGFLQREPDGRSYSVGLRTRRLAVGVLSTARVRTARLAVMRALARDVGETVNLALPDREGMLYLDRVETEWPLRIQLPVGSQVPFHCTAAGKLYLSTLAPAALEGFLRNADLPANTPNSLTDPDALAEEVARIRAAGHAEDDEEFVTGMVALAVPLRDANGRMPATLSFHAPTQRMPLERARSHLPRLKSAAEALSALL